MQISIFLAKIIGLYLVIVSFAVFLNAKLIKNIVATLPENPAFPFLILLSGVITLILGLLMVLSHNLWARNWTVIITLMSWLVLISGIIRMVFPQVVIAISKRMKLKGIMGTAVCSLFLGAYLTYQGFFGP